SRCSPTKANPSIAPTGTITTKPSPTSSKASTKSSKNWLPLKQATVKRLKHQTLHRPPKQPPQNPHNQPGTSPLNAAPTSQAVKTSSIACTTHSTKTKQRL